MRLKLKPLATQGISKKRTNIKPSPFQLLIVILFSIYVGGEVISSMWLSTYLVEQHGMSVPESANYVMGFFACMTLTRFSCFLFINPTREKWVLIASLVLPILFFSVGLFRHRAWAFAFVGLLGPFFPVFLSRISRQFPEDWRSLTVWVILAMQAVLMLAHLSLGRIADMLTIGKAYILALGLLLLTLVLLLRYLILETRFSQKTGVQILA